LERRDRVREIEIDITDPPDDIYEQIVTAMEKPFPALRSLSLKSYLDLKMLLNGSAPSLRDLTLSEISLPSLPQLLSSTSDLTRLSLLDIPDSGYIPPETMATTLSALPKLESLNIQFESPTPHLEPSLERRIRAPPLQTRFILPVLTFLEFQGVSEYLDVLAARFDAPLLDEFMITFLHQPVFDIPQVVRFFSSYLDPFKPSSLTLKFEWSDCAYISFPSNTTHHSAFSQIHSWKIMGKDPDCQLTSVAQICSQIPSFRSSVKSLIIECGDLVGRNPTLWLQLFHSFPAAQSLQIPVALEPSIASALETPTEGSPTAAAEVLPLLHSLSIVENKSGETVHVQQQPIQSFVAARQRSGRTVAISRIRKSNLD
jgi:hypothetical protein